MSPHIKIAVLVLVLAYLLLPGCAFNFELTSQRTALENQILGSYEELDDDLLMISSVRSLNEEGKKKDLNLSDLQAKALKARQNQEFNRDDIDELKTLQILGETADGRIVILPKNLGLVSDASKEQIDLAQILVKEENHDRVIVWQRIIELNENLSEKDLPKVQETFAKQIYTEAPAGHWFATQDGSWQQKTK